MNRRAFLSNSSTSQGRSARSHKAGDRNAGSVLPGSARPAVEESRSFTETPSLEPYSGPWDKRAALHLLRRTIVAPSYDDLESALARSLDDLLDTLLADPGALPAPPRYVGEWMNADLIYWESGRVDVANTFFSELRRWWLMLMVNGGLSLRERMTLFWHNHFANNASLVVDARYMYQQNQLFRRHALGNFRELVRGVTLDKAMLEFLNGKGSKRDYTNENYARELQELFTIGIADNDGNPNYTQDDVVQAALALTGWDWIGLKGEVMSNFITGHDPVDKVVYGEAIKGNLEGGPELARLLDIIFAKEESARYVIRKLYRFFVYTDTTLTPVMPIDQEVEEKIIAPLAADFRAAEWDIVPVLRRLLRSRHFFDAGFVGGMIKSPVDLFAGLLRAMQVGPFQGERAEFGAHIVQERSMKLGQNLFHPPGVQGWQFHRSWIGTTTLPQRNRDTDDLLFGTETTIIDRLNPLISGPINRNGSFALDVLAFARQFPSFTDPRQLVADIALHLLGYPPSDALLLRLEREMVGDRGYEWNDITDDLRATKLRTMLRHLMRAPNFQLM